jgi:hypothetical protein
MEHPRGLNFSTAMLIVETKLLEIFNYLRQHFKASNLPYFIFESQVNFLFRPVQFPPLDPLSFLVPSGANTME